MQRQQTGGRFKAAMFLLGALVVAGLTAFLVWKALQAADSQLQAAKKGPQRDPVVVAATDLYMGIPIALEDLRTTELAATEYPAKLVFHDPAELVGRTPRERILQGELVRDERLASKDAGVGLNAIITPGMRAMTIETNTESSLAGFLQPANYVDVIVTIRPDDSTISGKWVTETILQGIRVLAVGDSTGGASDKKKSAKDKRAGRRKTAVTLEVSLEDSEKLALAKSRGDLHLVLRSDIDILLHDTTGPLNTNALLGVAEVQGKPVPVVIRNPRPGNTKPRYTTAEVIEGSDRSIERFNESGERVTDDNRRGRR